MLERPQRESGVEEATRESRGAAMAEALRKFMEAVGRDPRGRPQGRPQGHGKASERGNRWRESRAAWAPRDMPPAWPQLSTPSNLRHLCRRRPRSPSEKHRSCGLRTRRNVKDSLSPCGENPVVGGQYTLQSHGKAHRPESS